MAFHLLGFYSSILPSGGTLTYTELAPVADAQTSINPATSRFWSSRDATVLAGYAGAPSAYVARLYTPWKPKSHIRPLNQATLPTSPPNVALFAENPLEIAATHEIIFDGWANVGVASDMYGLAWYTTSAIEPAPRGEVLTIMGSGGVVAAIPRQWTELTNPTWETQLPAGVYGIVGSFAASNNSIAHRFILEGESMRPGGLSGTLISVPHPLFSVGGGLGLWGRFTAPVMPRIEVLCNAPDVGVLFWIQVVRLG